MAVVGLFSPRDVYNSQLTVPGPQSPPVPQSPGILEATNLARNLEIKARLDNYETQFELAQTLADGRSERIHQIDVFFRCDRGRLKLRLFDDGHGELIFYQRGDQTGPKLSDYVLAGTEQPASLREALARAYGELATVEKERMLIMCGRTRIHLDRVRGLGDFLELEVVLEENESPSDGTREAAELMEKLEIAESALIDCAYVDLLTNRPSI